VTCCICGNEIVAHPITNEGANGCNAQPVMEGRCCIVCDQNVVLPRRMENAMEGKDPYEGKGIRWNLTEKEKEDPEWRKYLKID
jgi:hypothetical protein